jgi:mono/diheme cytochrome c family protein
LRSTSGNAGRGPGKPLFAALGLAVFASLAGCSAPAADSSGGATMAAVDPAANASVERGRVIVLHHGCGDCHGGLDNPDSPAWMAGVMTPLQEFAIPMNPMEPTFSYPLDESDPSYFLTRPRNITPDNETGIGRFTERQIFNALRFGLRPEETPDVEITSTVPGEGNFPAVPRFLAPPMPWQAFRHMTDQELWDVAAYLMRGVRPVQNEVAESEGPPDFWAGFYADPMVGLGSYPARPFPAAQEVATP